MTTDFEDTLELVSSAVSDLESMANELDEKGSPNLARGVRTLADEIGKCVDAVHESSIKKVDRQLTIYGFREEAAVSLDDEEEEESNGHVREAWNAGRAPF